MEANLTVTELNRTVEALRAEIEALHFKAFHDDLTGLGNRRLLEERCDGRGGFFVAIDLNGFKKAQDAHPRGHEYGDEILRRFARFLVRRCQGQERVAVRSGGDEFIVWSPTLHAAKVTSFHVRSWYYDGVTASAGIGPDRATADRELYKEKERLK